MSEMDDDKMMGGASKQFEHEHFRMSINTFGALELYNKKEFDKMNVTNTAPIMRIDGIINAVPLLRITNKTTSIITPDITEGMKTLFKEYLIFFNFIITLIRYNRRFTDDNAGNDDLITFLQTKVYSNIPSLPGKIPAYSSILKIIGKNEVAKPKMGIKTEVVKTEWKKSGMKKTGGKWKYYTPTVDNAPQDADERTIESGYTLIMDMLIAKANLANQTMDIDIDIDIIEVCKLLAICESERVNKNKPELSNKLIKSLKSFSDAVDTEEQKLATVVRETNAAAKVAEIEQLVDAAQKTEAAQKATIDLYTIFLDNTYTSVIEEASHEATPSTTMGGGEEENEEQEQDEEQDGEGEQEEMEGEQEQEQDEEQEVEQEQEGEQNENNGGSKSKTLKRKKQLNNKSRRRFSYGGRKAYNERKQQRQEKQKN